MNLLKYLFKNSFRNSLMYSTTRPEGRHLRSSLIIRRMSEGRHGECDCSLCSKTYPLFLLETAHLRPRHTLSKPERITLDCVELMCRVCHSIYDNGFVGVDKEGIIGGCKDLNVYGHLPILSRIGTPYPFYNLRNEQYFLWHYEHVFRRGQIYIHFKR